MTKDELIAYVQKTFGDKLTPMESGKHDPWFEIKADDLFEVCRALKEDEQLKLDYLCNLGGADTGERFEVHYNLTSISKHHRLDLKVILPYDAAEIDSVQEIWPAANWFEREMWELYGIEVNNHERLERFLLPDEWDQGFPMRKNWDAPDFIKMPEK